MDKTKEKIPKQCIICNTCFMSLATIGDNLFTRHLNNNNHVQKDSNDLLSVIIILGTHIHGDETSIYDDENMNDIGKIVHFMKHSHGRCVVGAMNKILHQGYICTVNRAVLSFILHGSIFLHFLQHCTIFYDKYITSDDGNKSMDDYGSASFPKQKVRKLYNANYQKTDSNQYYVLKMTI